MSGMKIASALVIVLFGIAVLFVETVPGSFTIEPSLLGYPIIGVGAWMLYRSQKSLQP
jgi:hypothetical protein